MVDFKITKQEKILEVNNCMCHNYYYLIHGRIYNENRTKFIRFKYIEWFDIFEVQEFFEEKEYITEKDIKNYLNSLENSYLLSIKSFDDIKGITEFISYCNQTIENYNKIARG